ncbi:hypothetical protein WN943_005773 [Citrus x changshan-huyou]
MIGLSRSAISVPNSAELSITGTPNCDLIHKDVAEASCPYISVKAAIFESFARQNKSESEIGVTPSIKYPLLYPRRRNNTLCFPAGSNGNYVSAIKFLKAIIVNIPTVYEVGLKKTEKTLVTILETVKKPWVYISGPTVNPTGLLYSNKEIENILTVCVKYGPRVVIDASFSGLQFNYEGWGGWNLEGCLSKLYRLSLCLCWRAVSEDAYWSPHIWISGSKPTSFS